MPPQTISLSLAHKPTQQIEIVATGEKGLKDIVLGRTEMNFDDPDDSPRLDPVAIFAAAANRGFLGGDQIDPSLTSCKILESTVRPQDETIRWRLALENLPLTAFRVLINTLIARHFDKIQIITNAKPATLSSDDVSKLPYPAPFAPLPFLVEREDPMKTVKDRALRLFLAEPPPDHFVESVYNDLNLWVSLMNVGAYPRPADHPSKSGVLPDFAVLIDESTFEQAFPEAFFCDESAFDAALNWAICLNRLQRVEKVQIS